MRPIFRVNAKEIRGEQHGSSPTKTVKLVVKAGYAVGAMTVRVGATADGFSLTYMKIGSDGQLDPTTAYESEWVGPLGQVTMFGGGGIAVIGLAVRATGKDVTGLGLVLKA